MLKQTIIAVLQKARCIPGDFYQQIMKKLENLGGEDERELFDRLLESLQHQDDLLTESLSGAIALRRNMEKEKSQRDTRRAFAHGSIPPTLQ